MRVFVFLLIRSVTWGTSRTYQFFTHLIVTRYGHFLLYVWRVIITASVYDPEEVVTFNAPNFKLGMRRSISGIPRLLMANTPNSIQNATHHCMTPLYTSYVDDI